MTTAPATAAPADGDAFDRAQNATATPKNRDFFGQVAAVDAWDCVLPPKGAGGSKRPFDPTRDDVSRRRTAIKLGIACERQDGSAYMVEQEALDNDKTWLLTVASANKLKINLRTFVGAFVHFRRVPTGETFAGKDRATGKPNGEIIAKTAIEIVEVFAEQEDMDAAAAVLFKRPAGGVEVADLPSNLPGGPTTSRPSVNTPQPISQADSMIAMARAGIPALWLAARGDRDVFVAMLASSGLNRYMPDSHPDVVALTNDAMTPEQFSGAVPF